MKAIVFNQYGSPDVLELQEAERPVPADEEVLIRVHAASVNDWDWGALHGDSFVNRLIFGLLKPKKHILGSDVAGRVEAVGKRVHRFQPGDQVFGDLSGRWGGFAEYVCAPERSLAPMAPGMTFEAAAAIPQAGLLALQGLQVMGPMQPGQRLLINGAGGGVGTFAIQMAKRDGVEVTAVDRSEKWELLRSLGADHVLDYTQEDFTRNGERYDFILDVKTIRSIFDCAGALSPKGTYVTVGGSTARLLQALLVGPCISLLKHKKIRILALKPNQGLATLNEWFEAGKVVPVIDGPYTFSEVPRAFRHFGEGKHKGKVVITVTPSNEAPGEVPSPTPSRLP